MKKKACGNSSLNLYRAWVLALKLAFHDILRSTGFIFSDAYPLPVVKTMRASLRVLFRGRTSSSGASFFGYSYGLVGASQGTIRSS